MVRKARTRLGDNKHWCTAQKQFFLKKNSHNQDDFPHWPAQRLWHEGQTMGLKVEMMIKLPVASIPTGGFSPSNCDIIGRLSLLCTDSIWVGDCYLLHLLPQVIDTCFLLAEVWVFANNQLTGEFFFHRVLETVMPGKLLFRFIWEGLYLG